MNNTSSVFISYSHANESCLNEFKVHLANLIRTKRIEPWYDRFLLGGDKLDQKILDKLSRSDIVIFLVSPEFIDSYYCYEKELKVAIENRENGASRVFPIILDHCDWKGSDILKQCVLLPRDAKPVSTFENKNEAYLHIVDELRRVLDELDKEQLREPVRTQLPIEISSVFAEYLNDTEIVFQNSNVSEIKLENIFVFPDLKSIILDEKAADVISHSHEMIDSEHWSDTDKLILGGEQSGKTSLAKTAFKSLYLKGYLPVIIDCSEIGSKLDVQKDLRKFIDRQYTIEDIENFEYSRAVVILDDFHLLKFNSKYRALYLSEIEKISKNGKLIFADSDLRFEESTFNIFENFERYEILRFGYVKRDELINKWNSLGVEETIEEADLQKLNDSTRMKVESILIKNVVPAKPVFILTILQTLESTNNNDYKLTSHGHCYQFLIQQALQKAKIRPNEVPTYINYLTHFAYFTFKAASSSISAKQLGEFQNTYSKSYLVGNHNDIVTKFQTAHILQCVDGKYSFNYKYVLYFYVAKYISENIESDEVKELVTNLTENLQNEKFANILIFITHHTKKQEVVSQILDCTAQIFDRYDESGLNVNDFDHISESVRKIPDLILEQRNVEKERKSKSERMDRLDAPVVDRNVEPEDAEDSLQHDDIAMINKSAKAVEVIGQILRNRHGDLKIPMLKELATSSLNVGFRFLKFYLDIHAKSEHEVISIIAEMLKKGGGVSNDKIEDAARSFYVQMGYQVSLAVIKKIALSCGSEELLPIFEEMKEEKTSPAVQLVNLSMLLEFSRKLPINEIERLKIKFESNPIAERILKEIVVQHLYLHYVSNSDRQRLSEILQFSTRSQRIIQNRKDMKRTAK